MARQIDSDLIYRRSQDVMKAPLDSLDPALKADLKQQRFRDLIQRSWPGIMIYPLIWWTIALPRLWYAPTQQNFLWLGGIGALMLAFAGIRILLLKRFQARLAREAPQREWELTTGVVLCSGFWGLVAALSLTHSPLQSLDTVMILSTAGLCAGGIASLSISASTVRVFLACMLVPTVLLVFLGYSTQSIEFASVMLVFGMGMYWVSSLPREEYHNAVISNLKLSHHAAYLNELSTLDSLTGLKNRRYFDQLLENELRRAVRNGHTLSLLLVDLDRFKAINDKYGHLVGDECLRTAAKVLSTQVKRATDEVARFGGEEFAVILPGTTESDARQLAEIIRASIESTQVKGSRSTIRLSASVGGATLTPTHLTTPRDLIKLADDALYAAKGGGRNQVRFAATSAGNHGP